MKTLRVAIAQLHSVAGDLAGNSALIRTAIEHAAATHADVLLTPEMALTGYPVEDLLGDNAFLSDTEQEAAKLADLVPHTLVAAIGAAMRPKALPRRGGATLNRHNDLDSATRTVRNVIVIANDHDIYAAHAKALLPTYSVFDDARWTAPGSLDQPILTINDIPVALAVCEDVWTPEAADRAADEGAKVLLVANASPYYHGKPAERLALLTDQARRTGMYIVYVNAVGGQDEVVYDGGSLVIAPDGTNILRAPLFQTGQWYVDLEIADDPRDTIALNTADHGDYPIVCPAANWPQPEEEIYTALVTGLRDYVRDNGFTQVLLGLSGGLDSALAATIAVDALGADAVRGIGMPGPYSSEGSVDDARDLADRLGIRFDVIPIADTFTAELSTLGDLLTGPGVAVATENIQARLRALHLMTLANANNAMVINTGNKSESSVGYFTLGGDSSGGLSILRDTYKTEAYRLAEWRNADATTRGEMPPIPQNTITKPPSAELAPDQVDTNSLPPYPILDTILERYLEHFDSAQSITDILIQDHHLDPDEAASMVVRVLTMTDRAEHKRRQVAPGIKITRRAFGRDRRVPITSGRRHHLGQQR